MKVVDLENLLLFIFLRNLGEFCLQSTNISLYRNWSVRTKKNVPTWSKKKKKDFPRKNDIFPPLGTDQKPTLKITNCNNMFILINRVFKKFDCCILEKFD